MQSLGVIVVGTTPHGGYWCHTAAPHAGNTAPPHTDMQATRPLHMLDAFVMFVLTASKALSEQGFLRRSRRRLSLAEGGGVAAKEYERTSCHDGRVALISCIRPW